MLFAQDYLSRNQLLKKNLLLHANTTSKVYLIRLTEIKGKLFGRTNIFLRQEK
jgi:hypothetical protein